jgi:predicted transcriptional regulator
MKNNSPKQAKLGDQELELLTELRERSPATVGEMAKFFGEPRGLARTTILTMMERLRKKGYLIRDESEPVFRYSPNEENQEALKGLVGDFVARALGGSLAPFVSYVVDSGKLSPDEVESLRKLVDTFEAAEGDGE